MTLKQFKTTFKYKKYNFCKYSMILALYSHSMTMVHNHTEQQFTLKIDVFFRRKVIQNQIFEELASLSWANILYDLTFAETIKRFQELFWAVKADILFHRIMRGQLDYLLKAVTQSSLLFYQKNDVKIIIKAIQSCASAQNVHIHIHLKWTLLHNKQFLYLSKYLSWI